MLVVVIWGLNFAVVKRALEVLEPLGFNALRHVIASAFLFVVLWLGPGVGRPRRSDIARIVAMGIVGVVGYQMAFIFGLDRTLSGNAALMLALTPVFVLLFGRGRGEGGRRAWLGVAISILGVAIVSASTLGLAGTTTLIGDIMLIGGAAVWAAYTIGAKPLIERHGPLRATAWTLWTGSIGLTAAGLPSLLRQDWAVVPPAAWAGVVFSAVFAIGVAYLLWYFGVQVLGGARTSVFNNLTPIVALAAGALWLDEPLTGYSIVGSIMVISGLILVPASGGSARDAANPEP
jgi:drug/metabolite transporter (DMT)-like permease